MCRIWSGRQNWHIVAIVPKNLCREGMYSEIWYSPLVGEFIPHDNPFIFTEAKDPLNGQKSHFSWWFEV